MPTLPLKAFAALAKSMAGAADSEIIAAAKQLSGDAVDAVAAPVVRGVRDILAGDFGILSAANPGRKLAPEENALRHSNLGVRLREMGYEPLEQRGVYGAEPEPSYLVPGLQPDITKQLGQEFEQEAVISNAGWHQLRDGDYPAGAHFPPKSTDYDQAATDFYSELLDPSSGQPLKYQVQYDWERDLSRPSAAPMELPGPALTDETAALSSSAELITPPSHMGSTVSAIAAPAAAQAIPDDPDSNLDDYARIGLYGAGAVGMAARAFPKGLKAELDGIRAATKAALKAQGVPTGKMDSALRTAVRDHLRSLGMSAPEVNSLEHGYHTISLPIVDGIDFDKKLPLTKVLRKAKEGAALSDWSKTRVMKAYERGNIDGAWGDPKWLFHATNGDPEAAVQFSRLLGAYSPGQKTHANTLNALEAFIRSAAGEAPEDILTKALHGHPRPNTVRDNLSRAIQGGRIFQDKVESLAGAEVGVRDKIPIDMWLLRALGVNSDKTPPKGAYKLISQAMMSAAKEAGEPDPFTFMAKVWMGMQKIANNPTPSFSEAVSTMRLPGPLTRPDVQDFVRENFEQVRQNIFDGAAELTGQARIAQGRSLKKPLPDMRGMVSPIATDPKMSLQEFLQALPSTYRSGLDRGDVLGKVRIPKTERNVSLQELRRALAKQQAQPR